MNNQQLINQMKQIQTDMEGYRIKFEQLEQSRLSNRLAQVLRIRGVRASLLALLFVPLSIYAASQISEKLELSIFQSGDTISALAKHFGVNDFEIISEENIPQTGFLLPGQMLMIPNRLAHTTTDTILIPDSEIVFSSSASNFDINKLVDSYGGKLSSYKENVIHLGIGSGAEIIEFISII